MTMHGGRESIHFMNTSWSLTRESISLIPAIPAKNLIAAVDYELFSESKNLEYKRNIACVMFEKTLLNVDLVLTLPGLSCRWIIDAHTRVTDTQEKGEILACGFTSRSWIRCVPWV